MPFFSTATHSFNLIHWPLFLALLFIISNSEPARVVLFLVSARLPLAAAVFFVGTLSFQNPISSCNKKNR